MVPLQEDRDEEAAEHEDREVTVLEHPERIEPERIGDAEGTIPALRGRRRERQREEPRECAGDRRDAHRDIGVLHLQELPDQDPGGDPPHRPHHADRGELLLRTLHMMKGDVVRQRERGSIAEREEEEGRGEGEELRLARGDPHHRGAGEMQRRHQLLRVDQSVGDDPHEERGHQCGDRHHREGDRLLHVIEPQTATEIGHDRDAPAPPDEVLEEHHRAKFDFGHFVSSRMRIFLNSTTSP